MGLPETFRPFGTVHLVTATVSVVCMALLCAAGFAAKKRGKEGELRRAWGWSILVVQIVVAVWWLMPANFSLERSVPLNMCRLVAFVAAGAMITDRRWLRAILFFWGLGLCTQAIITPVFPEGPARLVFWVFWLGHTQIVGSAVYDVVVRGFRPTGRDLGVGLGSAIAYTAAVFAIDAATGRNYGGLGPTLFEAPNLARRLGPWPGRVGWISLMATVWLVVLWLIARPRGGRGTVVG